MKRNKNMRFSYIRKGMETSQIIIGINKISRSGDTTVKLFSNDKNVDDTENSNIKIIYSKLNIKIYSRRKYSNHAPINWLYLSKLLFNCYNIFLKTLYKFFLY